MTPTSALVAFIASIRFVSFNSTDMARRFIEAGITDTAELFAAAQLKGRVLFEMLRLDMGLDADTASCVQGALAQYLVDHKEELDRIRWARAFEVCSSPVEA